MDAIKIAQHVEMLAGTDALSVSTALSALRPEFQRIYDQGESAWVAGAAADFLAAVVYASPRYYLRLHAHAPGAADTDFHTHKGRVVSRVLCGAVTNVTAELAGTDGRADGELWRCSCLPDGTHARQRTGEYARVSSMRAARGAPGEMFTVEPGAYHQLVIARSVLTVTLCLFEWTDPHAPDAQVLASRTDPVVVDREMNAGLARLALRSALDNLDF